MGQRIVTFSSQTIQQMITEGNRFGGEHRIIRVVVGLPEGATFHGVATNPQFNIPDAHLSLLFSHPEWPDVPDGKDIPMQEVVFEEIGGLYDDYIEALLRWPSPPSLLRDQNHTGDRP